MATKTKATRKPGTKGISKDAATIIDALVDSAVESANNTIDQIVTEAAEMIVDTLVPDEAAATPKCEPECEGVEHHIITPNDSENAPGPETLYVTKRGLYRFKRGDTKTSKPLLTYDGALLFKALDLLKMRPADSLLILDTTTVFASYGKPKRSAPVTRRMYMRRGQSLHSRTGTARYPKDLMVQLNWEFDTESIARIMRTLIHEAEVDNRNFAPLFEAVDLYDRLGALNGCVFRSLVRMIDAEFIRECAFTAAYEVLTDNKVLSKNWRQPNNETMDYALRFLLNKFDGKTKLQSEFFKHLEDEMREQSDASNDNCSQQLALPWREVR